MSPGEASFARAYAKNALVLKTTLEGPCCEGGVEAAMLGLSVIALMESNPGDRSEAVILRDASEMASRPTVRAEVDRLLRGQPPPRLRITWPDDDPPPHADAH